MAAKEFTQQEYEKFDNSMNYRADKIRAVQEYNDEHKTNYKYISEFMQKMYSCDSGTVYISSILEITSNSVIRILHVMGVEINPSGGPNRHLFCNLSAKDVADIRASKEMQTTSALKYGVSNSTICKVKSRKGRWAKI